MTLDERVRDSLRSVQAGVALRALVGNLAQEGWDKARLVEMLEDFVVKQRERADYCEDDEDAVMDLLDALKGWCHPTAELLPEKPEQ